jgi:hypothetical protein
MLTYSLHISHIMYVLYNFNILYILCLALYFIYGIFPLIYISCSESYTGLVFTSS